jgi:hypothetical protein
MSQGHRVTSHISQEHTKLKAEVKVKKSKKFIHNSLHYGKFHKASTKLPAGYK